MTKTKAEEHRLEAPEGYQIYGQPGYFTVNFTSPYNSTHQISGFRSEEDALAWIQETKLLISTYR